MPRAPLRPFRSRYMVLPANDVDTDQIIPARFLKTISREGLGGHAFHDWRHRADGSRDPDFVLDRPEHAGRAILVAGRNFGCGSSREHAVWALLGAGIRAVVSADFADIFRANALGNGLLPVQLEADVVARLAAPRWARDGELTVDLEQASVTLPDGTTVRFPVPPFARHCLLHGVDELEFILEAQDDIDRFELSHASGASTVAGEVLA